MHVTIFSTGGKFHPVSLLLLSPVLMRSDSAWAKINLSSNLLGASWGAVMLDEVHYKVMTCFQGSSTPNNNTKLSKGAFFWALSTVGNSTILIASGCIRKLREVKKVTVLGNLLHVQLEPIKVLQSILFAIVLPCDQFACPAMYVVWSGRG